MIDRRTFLETAGAASLACTGLAPDLLRATDPVRGIDRIGVQLYTVRSEMQKSVERTLERVAAIGYREVEFAGYFDRSPQRIRSLLEANQLTSPATHIPLAFLEQRWQETLDLAETIGHRYLVVPSIPRRQRTTIDDYRRIAQLFNRAGAAARARELTFAYHNHDFEFVPLQGEIPFDVLTREADPDLVKLEMDLFWVIKGGHDPVEYFEPNPDRIPLVHVKDMDATGKMVDVGAGQIDFARIFAKSEIAGIEHFFVEHDTPADPFASITASYEYLRELEF